MAKEPVFSIKGLYTSPNPLSGETVPPGACSVLKDLVIDRAGIATPRGGLTQLATNLGGAGLAAYSAKWFGGKLLTHNSDGTIRFLQVVATPTWQTIFPATSTIELGTLSGPDSSFPVRFCESGGNLYASTKWGVLRIQTPPDAGAYSAAGVRAGCPKATFSAVSLNGTIVSNVAGPLVADSAAAYRAVWCYKDSQGRIVRGEPSGRYIIRHTPMDIQPSGSASSYEFIGNGASNATATRASGSNTVVLTFASNRYKGPVYVVGDQITVTYSDNETSTNFKSGTYTISAVTGSTSAVACTISYTVNATNDPNPASNQTAIRLIKVRGPAKAANLNNILVPAGITTSHFVQLYRSEITSSASITPSDEMRLCAEVAYSSSAPFAVALPYDTASALVLGETLYTSPSIGESGNIRLPRCRDLVEYQSCMFYLNTELLPRIKVQILTPAASSAAFELAYNGSSLSTGQVPNNPNPGAYGTSELVQQQAESVAITYTGKSIFSTPPIFSSYSDLVADDLSTIGLIVIESQNFDVASFEFRTAFGANTQPQTNGILPAANTVSGATSFSDVRKNRLYYSKPQEPEHVAAASFIDVGSANYPILRGVVVQNSLFILKADGIFRIIGDGYDWTVEPFDLTKKIIASESVQVVGGKCYFLADCGVVELDESGARMVSTKIDDVLIADMVAGTPTKWQSVATDLDHRYVLTKANWGGVTNSANSYVYNLNSKEWTTWKFNTVGALTSDAGYIYDVVNQATGVLKLQRPTSSTNILDYNGGSAPLMLSQITLLPFYGDDPSQMKHFGAVKVVFGPVSGVALPVVCSFGSELAGYPVSYTITLQPSPLPQTVVFPVSRQLARCAQLSMNLQMNNTGTLFQVLGFEPVYQVGKNQKVGHR